MKRYLLDTHIALWALSAPNRLGAQTRRIVERGTTFVSALSIWELRLKQARGQLDLPPGSLVTALSDVGAQMIDLSAAHAEAAASIANLHGDPIDRLLIGTALSEQMILVTRDERILEHAASALGKLLMEG